MSLRTRLLISFTLIAVLCLSSAALAMTALLQKYRDQAQVTQLNDMARPIAIQLGAMLRSQSNMTEVWANMLEQAQKNNVYIILVDDKGNILRQSSPDTNVKQPIIFQDALPRGIKEPSSGTLVTSTKQTFVYAAHPIAQISRSVVTAAVAPTAVKVDTMILARPRAGNLLIWASLVRPFLFAALIAFCISAVMAVFLARSIYHPVQRLEKAAESISHGQYDQQIPAEGPREIRGLAASFNEMSQNIKESHLQLRHFVADVSHQLKSPLTSIQGFAQAMLDGTADDHATRQKAAQIIVDESKRMIRQVNELLQLSRMQAGQVKMAQELVDMKELLVHCQEIFALYAEEKNVRIETKIEPLAPVTGDADHLEDVFCNLLDNALKNTPGHGVVEITGRNSSNNAVEITVSDSGPGIPPEQLPYLFKRFYQASGLRSGFGLGLAIAREIVVAHGGKIEAFSSPGEGAKFVVTLSSGVKKTD